MIGSVSRVSSQMGFLGDRHTEVAVVKDSRLTQPRYGEEELRDRKKYRR